MEASGAGDRFDRHVAEFICLAAVLRIRIASTTIALIADIGQEKPKEPDEDFR